MKREYEAIPEHQEPKVSSSILALEVLKQLPFDGLILFKAKMLRMFSFGMLSVILTLYLSEIGLSETGIGTLFSLTMLGDVLISLFLTLRADKFGRRKTLIIGSVLAGVTSIIFASTTNFSLLTIAATFGVISPSGSEVGPFMAIEISALCEIVEPHQRTKLMTWYNLVGYLACASGALSCGFFIYHHDAACIAHDIPINRIGLLQLLIKIYAAIQIALGLCFCALGPNIEVQLLEPDSSNSGMWGLHRSTKNVFNICLLFIIDAFAGSLVYQTLISDWFYLRFSTSSQTIGTALFICNSVAAISTLFAAHLADRIGLIYTMVVTHVPSNILLILVPLMPSESLAILILCLRFSISQMDVPTRNAYVQGMVDPSERSAASGVTNVVRSIGTAFGPLLTGFLFSNASYENYPFYICGLLKLVYDFLLLCGFSSVKSTSDKFTR
jgi:MFS family permease